MFSKRTRIKLIGITALLLFFAAGFCTCATVFAAEQIKILGQISVTYDSNPQILKNGSVFYQSIPSACTSLVFEYADTVHPEGTGETYAEYVIANSYTETPVDEAGLGYTDGLEDKKGISLFYDSTSTKGYVLSNFPIFTNTSCYQMFYNKTKLETIEFNNFYISETTIELRAMFSGCSGLKTLNLNSWNTENVENMSYMFQSCSSLSDLNINAWDVSGVKDMCYMFSSCGKLTTLNLNNWNTINVTNMSSMFSNCRTLSKLNINKWNTSNVTNMNSMFFCCYELQELDLSNWDTSSVTNMNGMFYSCSKLSTIYVGEDWSTSSVTSSSSVFDGCSKLVGSCGTTYNSSYISAARANNDITSTGYLTDAEMKNGYRLLSDDLKTILNSSSNYKNLIIGNTQDYPDIVNNVIGTTCDLDGLGNIKYYYQDLYIYVLADKPIYLLCKDGAEFMYCSFLKTINFENLNIDYIKSFYDAFGDCTSLEEVDLSNLKGSPLATKMVNMFSGCTSLEKVNLSGWENLKVTDMSSMFSGCTNLIDVKLTDFNTSKVTSMSQMFYSCESLTELDLSSFNTSKVTSMSLMFDSCTLLEYVDLSSFDTSKVTDMGRMFYYCESLTKLDLSSFNTSSVTTTAAGTYDYGMFGACSALKTIYVSDLWNMARNTDSNNTFLGCSALVGGNGTSYQSSHNDATYAELDTDSQAGYLTGVTTLITGAEFNDQIPNDCTEIIFGKYSEYESEIGGLTGVLVSSETTGNGFYNAMLYVKGTTAYVLSKGLIFANADCSEMFRDKINLQTIRFENFNTNKVTSMFAMFYNCTALTELDITSFKTNKVERMQSMFMGCEQLETIYVSKWWTTKTIANDIYGSYMFNGCSSLVGDIAYDLDFGDDYTLATYEGGYLTLKE